MHAATKSSVWSSPSTSLECCPRKCPSACTSPHALHSCMQACRPPRCAPIYLGRPSWYATGNKLRLKVPSPAEQPLLTSIWSCQPRPPLSADLDPTSLAQLFSPAAPPPAPTLLTAFPPSGQSHTPSGSPASRVPHCGTPPRSRSGEPWSSRMCE